MGNFVGLIANILPQWAKKTIKIFTKLTVSALPGDLDIEVLGFKHLGDKFSHGYLQYYDFHFSSVRKNKLNIFEIGIGGYADPKDGGASLRLWQDYFPNGRVFGLDIYDKSAHEDKRIKTFIGSQNEPSFLRELASKIGKIDIIIDDGSHVNEHIITSFNVLFPLLGEDGIYVIEDINTSYSASYGGSSTDLDSKSTAIGMVKDLIDSLHYQFIGGRVHTMSDGHIQSIHCYPGIIFIKKGLNKKVLSAYETELVANEAAKMVP